MGEDDFGLEEALKQVARKQGVDPAKGKYQEDEGITPTAVPDAIDLGSGGDLTTAAELARRMGGDAAEDRGDHWADKIKELEANPKLTEYGIAMQYLSQHRAQTGDMEVQDRAARLLACEVRKYAEAQGQPMDVSWRTVAGLPLFNQAYDAAAQGKFAKNAHEVVFQALGGKS